MHKNIKIWRHPEMRLFIAEKPSLGRAIAENLGKGRKSEGYIDCGGDIVTWCFGHLLETAPPQYYNPANAKWGDRTLLPIVPSHFVLLPRKDAGAQIGIIKSLLKKCDIVVNAGDPDREGQLLVDEVLEHLNYKGPCHRIWLAALDPESVAKALASLKENAIFAGYRNAADTRRKIDWLGGLNMTRAMTIFGNSIGMDGVLSIGRVQSPTLALVVARDREIENFKPVDYAVVQASMKHQAGTFTATFKAPQNLAGTDENGRIIDFSIAEKIKSMSENKAGIIANVVKKAGKEAPPMPYSLSLLQKEASARWGMGAQDVLNTAQKLYEMKLTTYPRTDCGFLPEEQFADARKILKSLACMEVLHKATTGANPDLKSKAWNSQKITAHHGIIPTGMAASGLSGRELDIFQMIALRYIEQFYPPLEFETTMITVELDRKTTWEASGRVVKHQGWKACNRSILKNGETLPQVAIKDPVHSLTVEVLHKQTEPPPRYSEGTLIAAMTSIHLYVQDPAARSRLKETSGLGTEATRAGILETLKKRGYLEAKGKNLISTPKGRSVIDLCPHSFKDIVSTALLEDQLAEIQDERLAPAQVVACYAQTLKPMIDALFATDVSKMGVPVAPAHPCPECGANLRRILGKKSKKHFWLCGNDSCNAIFSDAKGKPGEKIEKPKISNEFSCPDCGSPLAKRKSNKYGSWFWSCTNYPGCKWSAPDDNGKPGMPRQRVTPPVNGDFKCPKCGKLLKYGVSQKTNKPYWACFEKSKKHGKAVALFFDIKTDGSPAFN